MDPRTPDAHDTLAAAAPHAFCVLDSAGAVVSANDVWVEVFGKVGAPGTRDFLDATRPSDAAKVEAALRDCRAGGPPVSISTRCTLDDGTSPWFAWTLSAMSGGGVLAIGRDVTRERRRREAVAELQMLEDEAERLAGLGSWRLDLADGSVTFSPEMYRLLGLEPGADVDLAEVSRSALGMDAASAEAAIGEALAAPGLPSFRRYRIELPGGGSRWLHVQGNPVRDAEGNAVAIIGVAQDVTAPLLAEAALTASEDRYRSIINGMRDAYFRADAAGRLVLTNPAAARMYGFDSPEDMIGLDAGSLYADEGERDRALADMRAEGFLSDRVGRGKRKDGTAFWVSLNIAVVRDESGEVVGTEGFARDISDRVAAEEARSETVSLLQATLESTADGILVVDRDGRVASHNRTLTDMWGIPAALVEAGDDAALLDYCQSALEDPDEFRSNVAQLYARPDAESFDTLELKDGRVFERYSRPQFLDGVVVGRVWSFRDVSASAMAERALRRSEESLREAQAIARIGSYDYDIGHDSWTSSETMDAIFGIDWAYRRDLGGWLALVHADDRDALSHYVADEVIAQRRPFDKSYRVTRHSDGATVWVHGHGRLELDADGNPMRLLGTIQDITQQHRSEDELRHSNSNLERMVYDVAEAMGRMIEIRDQYTRGHQQRVARLSRDIAMEMKKPANDVMAVEMAAVVHDIGKLSIPSEILSKPGTLTALEFAFIHEHPLRGYEVLKDVPFPWPVADIVMQHHERMDGSGYPAGLRGRDILPLARLLAVADVVEAMATHRPYRAALGIDAAIEELRASQAKYDPDVVAACIRLHERGEIEF